MGLPRLQCLLRLQLLSSIPHNGCAVDSVGVDGNPACRMWNWFVLACVSVRFCVSVSDNNDYMLIFPPSFLQVNMHTGTGTDLHLTLATMTKLLVRGHIMGRANMIWVRDKESTNTQERDST